MRAIGVSIDKAANAAIKGDQIEAKVKKVVIKTTTTTNTSSANTITVPTTTATTTSSSSSPPPQQISAWKTPGVRESWVEGEDLEELPVGDGDEAPETAPVMVRDAWASPVQKTGFAAEVDGAWERFLDGVLGSRTSRADKKGYLLGGVGIAAILFLIVLGDYNGTPGGATGDQGGATTKEMTTMMYDAGENHGKGKKAQQAETPTAMKKKMKKKFI